MLYVYFPNLSEMLEGQLSLPVQKLNSRDP